MGTAQNDEGEVVRTIARLHALVLALVGALLGGVGPFVMTAWLLVKGGATPGAHLHPKGFASPYMMLAMPTCPEALDALTAAVHPHDSTARPQILQRDWNPEYHAVIRAFQRHTGVAAVLNTSFNLHGEPIVRSAADAVDTFERSGLPHLAVGHWLISKS